MVAVSCLAWKLKAFYFDYKSLKFLKISLFHYLSADKSIKNFHITF